MKIINEISKNEKCFIFQKIRFKTSRSVKDMIENHSYLIQRYTDDLFNISSNRRFYREKLLKKKKNPLHKNIHYPEIHSTKNSVIKDFNISLNNFKHSKSLINFHSSNHGKINKKFSFNKHKFKNNAIIIEDLPFSSHSSERKNKQDNLNKNNTLIKFKKNLNPIIKKLSFKQIKTKSLNDLIDSSSRETKQYIYNLKTNKLPTKSQNLLNLSIKLSDENEFGNKMLFNQIKNDLGKENIKQKLKKIRSLYKEKIKNFETKQVNFEIEKDYADLINFCDIYYKMEDTLFYNQKLKYVFKNYPRLRRKANIIRYSGEKLIKEIDTKTLTALNRNSNTINELYNELKKQSLNK